jgi:hypothetical protein
MSKSALQKAEKRVRNAILRAQEYRDEKEAKKRESQQQQKANEKPS